MTPSVSSMVNPPVASIALDKEMPCGKPCQRWGKRLPARSATSVNVGVGPHDDADLEREYRWVTRRRSPNSCLIFPAFRERRHLLRRWT